MNWKSVKWDEYAWTNKTSFEWLIYFPCFGRDDGIWECAVERDRCVENKG